MTDHAEEQEMEAEAMAAIFDTNFEVVDETTITDMNGNTSNRVWRITIYPETGTTDIQELETLNHVGCRLVVTLPETYPEIVPNIHIEIVKGLATEHQTEIQQIATEEATNNIGTPSIYAITERVREWLIENNTKGLDDISMHAQMIRKQLQEEKSKNKAQAAFETQKQNEDMTEAEREEIEVTKRRAEGTPCTKENFESWQANFLQEMLIKKMNTDGNNDDDGRGKIRKDKVKDVDRTGRMTGFEHFSNKMVNLEALEMAAAEAEEGFEADENLFEDDVDLDDMDFDDDDEDDEEEEDDDEGDEDDELDI